jgi:lipoic acid synthetase
MNPPARHKLDRKPEWLKVRAPSGERYARIKETLRRLDLHTVCEEARCPNVGECWGSGTATVMVLGHTCTRGCRFCAVTTGNPRGAVDPREPEHVARAIATLGLSYVVLTMVDRDDLLDGGAAHVASTVSSLHERQPGLLVEALVGDFGGRLRDVDVVLEARPDVFAHNVEVPRRLTPSIRDAKCSYDRSLDVLRHAKEASPERLTKSSIMVGVGESDDEVVETLSDLRGAGVDVVTVGQYLRPSPKHAPVDRYVPPERFSEFERMGLSLGFAFVASGPLVRSSYHAAEAFMATRLRGAIDDTRQAERANSEYAAPKVRSASLEQLISPGSLVRVR